jgi:hypothetical protein
MTIDASDIDVRRLPVVVDLPTAARLLGIGRTSAYELVRTGRWPTPVIRAGRLIRVPTALCWCCSASPNSPDRLVSARHGPPFGPGSCRCVPQSPRSNDGQMIKGPLPVAGKRASDLHFRCSGGRI